MVDDDPSSRADERRRLLAELDLERNQLIRNIETCRIRDIDRPFIGDWTLKDIVGHVATWEAEVVFALRELAAGRRPPLFSFDQATLDAWNRDHVERKRDLNFWNVLGQLRSGRDRLARALEAVPDDAFGEESSPEFRLIHSLADHDRSHWREIAAHLAGMAGVRRSDAPDSVPAETHVS